MFRSVWRFATLCLFNRSCTLRSMDSGQGSSKFKTLAQKGICEHWIGVPARNWSALSWPSSAGKAPAALHHHLQIHNPA